MNVLYARTLKIVLFVLLITIYIQADAYRVAQLSLL